jgi:hypothetical protein
MIVEAVEKGLGGSVLNFVYLSQAMESVRFFCDLHDHCHCPTRLFASRSSDEAHFRPTSDQADLPHNPQLRKRVQRPGCHGWCFRHVGQRWFGNFGPSSA